jgi:hypothetical protein
MPRSTARPSDIYRLPEHVRQAPLRPSPEPPPPPSRFPAWMGVAGVVAAVLVVLGLVLGGTVANTGNEPLVDVVTEDHAIAALTLYGAQVSAIEELRRREDIFAAPGPGAAASVAAQGVRQSQRALNAARKVVGANPLASGYWNSGAHSEVIEDLRRLSQHADLIALLTSTHDTLYSGTGSIPLAEARDRINAAVTGRPQPGPLVAWGNALLEQMEERSRRDEAERARANAGAQWAFEVTKVEPAAVRLLHNYIARQSPATISGLRGHPVAGPALAALERDRGPLDQLVQ